MNLLDFNKKKFDQNMLLILKLKNYQKIKKINEILILN